MKLEKIEKEMQKTREKIAEYQNRLKELDTLKTEQENLQIVQLVRSMRMTPQELKAFLSGDMPQDNQQYPAAPVAADNYTSRYEQEQEDNEDEE